MKSPHLAAAKMATAELIAEVRAYVLTLPMMDLASRDAVEAVAALIWERERRLRAERAEPARDAGMVAEVERDALLAAAGFKPGPLGDELRRKVVLDDIAGMRPEMVRARRAEADAQDDALLWKMHMADTNGGGNGLLAKVWKQRCEAKRSLLAQRDAEARAGFERGVREAAGALKSRHWDAHFQPWEVVERGSAMILALLAPAAIDEGTQR